MHGRRLSALVLGAFLSWLALPLLHGHEEGGRGGESLKAAPARTSGPTVHAAAPVCVVCELLAVAAPGLEPAPPLRVEAAQAATGDRAPVSSPEPRSARFSFVGAPRGPPASPLA